MTCRYLRYPHEKSQHGMPQANGRIERMLRDVLDGSRTVLIAAGQPSYFWALAAKCYAHTNSRTSKGDNLDPWSARFDTPCDGCLIPYGLVDLDFAQDSCGHGKAFNPHITKGVILPPSSYHVAGKIVVRSSDMYNSGGIGAQQWRCHENRGVASVYDVIVFLEEEPLGPHILSARKPQTHARPCWTAIPRR